MIVVPAPNTMIMLISNPNQRVGRDLTLECQVNIVRGITSSVDVVWIENGAEFNRMNNVTFTLMSNSLRYIDTFTISPLRTSDDGRMVECLAVINSSSLVNDSDSITLAVTGM